MAKDISIVREQDYFTLLAYVSANRVGEPIVWDFVVSVLPDIEFNPLGIG